MDSSTSTSRISNFFDITLFIILGMRIFGLDKKLPREINAGLGIVLSITFLLLIVSFFKPSLFGSSQPVVVYMK